MSTGLRRMASGFLGLALAAAILVAVIGFLFLLQWLADREAWWAVSLIGLAILCGTAYWIGDVFPTDEP